jgi:hypothetical protein
LYRAQASAAGHVQTGCFEVPTGEGKVSDLFTEPDAIRKAARQ